MQKKLLESYTRDCLPLNLCRVEETVNKVGARSYRVHFPKEDFWLQISLDPWVIEVQTKPSTVAQYKGQAQHLEDLFLEARNLDLVPSLKGEGGGHIHIDIKSAFRGDARLFRNFVVDFVNHPEFGAYGVLGGNMNNSPHLTQLSKKSYEEFLAVIAEFDRGEIKTIGELAEAINTHVYARDGKSFLAPKYQALNLLRSMLPDGEATLEIRAINPQQTPKHFFSQAELFEKRIEYLRRQEGLIPTTLAPYFNHGEKAASFRAYVEETGADWKDFEFLIEKFANGSFKDSCPQAFGKVRGAGEPNFSD